MRTMLKCSLPTEIGNKMMKEGAVEKAIGPLLAAMKPEAAYWYDAGDLRGGHFVFDLAESADIPKYSEPRFMLGCSVEFCPVMNLEDLMKGLAATK